MNYTDKKYQNSYNEKINYSIPNSIRLTDGIFPENNINQKFNNNYPSDMIFLLALKATKKVSQLSYSGR